MEWDAWRHLLRYVQTYPPLNTMYRGVSSRDFTRFTLFTEGPVFTLKSSLLRR